MQFTYYLPSLILGAVVVVALIWGVGVVRDLIRGRRNEITCIYCKTAASKTSSHAYLFLIPVFFGEKYEDAENYLRSHMRPIQGKAQIPSGQRACRVEVYTCPKCDKTLVHITDFLLVRGEEYIKDAHIFPYEPFRPLLTAWENQNYTF